MLRNARPKFAGRRLAGHNHLVCANGAVALVEPQVRFALFIVRAVASETVFGEQRPNLPIEIDGFFARGRFFGVDRTDCATDNENCQLPTVQAD